MERLMGVEALAERMALCRDCLVLRGPFFDSHNGCERVQRCGCESPDPPWSAFDYNCAVELCRCCASRVIRCRSKWSVFFCDACRGHVSVYNDAAGCKVIPIGRHSIMNGVALSAGSARKGSAGGDFARDVSEVFDRIGRLERLHHTHVARIAASIDAPGSTVPAAQYVDRAMGSQPSSAAAFAALALGMGVEASGTLGSP